MAVEKTYEAASVLALVGGVVILAVALTTALTPTTLPEVVVTATGLSTGIGVIIGALIMRSCNHRKACTGGAIAIVFGMASIIAGAGLLIGLALSVLGGLTALLKCAKKGSS